MTCYVLRPKAIYFGVWNLTKFQMTSETLGFVGST